MRFLKELAQPQLEPTRRTFVTAVMAGGPALGALWLQHDAENAALDVSPADSLVVYIDLLRDVAHEQVVEHYGRLEATRQTLSDAIRELATIVAELSKEIGRVGGPASVPFAGVAAVGRAAQLALATKDRAGSVDDVGLLEEFANGCLNCASLADTQERQTISQRARQLIDAIIAKVPDLVRLDQGVAQASTEFRIQVETVDKQLDAVRDEFMAAGAAAVRSVDSRNPPLERRQRSDQALASVSRSISLLNDVGGSRPAATSARQTLIDLLGGVQKWLSGMGEVRVASLRLISLAAPDGQVRSTDQRLRLRDLLEKYSPLATTFREIWLRALLTPVWIAFGDYATREQKIRQVLRAFPSKPPAADSREFVSELARFGLSQAALEMGTPPT